MTIKTIAFLAAVAVMVAVSVTLPGEAETPAKATIIATNVSCMASEASKTSIHLQTCRLDLPR